MHPPLLMQLLLPSLQVRHLVLLLCLRRLLLLLAPPIRLLLVLLLLFLLSLCWDLRGGVRLLLRRLTQLLLKQLAQPLQVLHLVVLLLQLPLLLPLELLRSRRLLLSHLSRLLPLVLRLLCLLRRFRPSRALFVPLLHWMPQHLHLRGHVWPRHRFMLPGDGLLE